MIRSMRLRIRSESGDAAEVRGAAGEVRGGQGGIAGETEVDGEVAAGAVQWAVIRLSKAFHHRGPVQPRPGMAWIIGGEIADRSRRKLRSPGCPINSTDKSTDKSTDIGAD